MSLAAGTRGEGAYAGSIWGAAKDAAGRDIMGWNPSPQTPDQGVGPTPDIRPGGYDTGSASGNTAGRGPSYQSEFGSPTAGPFRDYQNILGGASPSPSNESYTSTFDPAGAGNPPPLPNLNTGGAGAGASGYGGGYGPAAMQGLSAAGPASSESVNSLGGGSLGIGNNAGGAYTFGDMGGFNPITPVDTSSKPESSGTMNIAMGQPTQQPPPREIFGDGGPNKRMGGRTPANEISGLKALTY